MSRSFSAFSPFFVEQGNVLGIPNVGGRKVASTIMGAAVTNPGQDYDQSHRDLLIWTLLPDALLRPHDHFVDLANTSGVSRFRKYTIKDGS